MLTLEEAILELSYEPVTGSFVWKRQSRNGRRKLGLSDATRSDSKGYRIIGIKGKHYLAHRVAWLIYYGKFPDGVLDHIDGNKANNAIANLREVSVMENNHNRFSPSVTNSSGLLGVYYDKQKNRWRGEIIANKRRHRLGWFKTKEEAHAAYLGAKSILHPSATMTKGIETELTVEDLGEGTPSLGGWGRKRVA